MMKLWLKFFHKMDFLAGAKKDKVSPLALHSFLSSADKEAVSIVSFIVTNSNKIVTNLFKFNAKISGSPLRLIIFFGYNDLLQRVHDGSEISENKQADSRYSHKSHASVVFFLNPSRGNKFNLCIQNYETKSLNQFSFALVIKIL